MRQAQEERKIDRLLTEREKSSDERELESHIEEARAENIKNELRKIHKKKNEELWNSGNGMLGRISQPHPLGI